ncbi:MAG: D-glycero-beta-D-manno-heptose-7-phosphate kinase, partial [Candidatus Omnitrophota bacterium]|nr:D-glycero-beta-D-manno-heptose-7-phosphate kinase [Candidatus Omnitrophota bacterium]
MRNLKLEKLGRIIRNFNKASVLVVGDLMLDEFIWGRVSRISPEAPVPVVHVASESVMPGGASNVAHNICALGGKVCMAGVIGNDSRGDTLLGELIKRNVDTGGVIRDAGRQTTLKTRVIAHHQHVVRIDKETGGSIDNKAAEQIITFAGKVIKRVDAVIIEDYGKGVISPRLIYGLIKLAKRHKKIITIDPKENHFTLYKNVTAITPNHYEAAKAVKMQARDSLPIEKIGKKLLKQLNCDAVLMTLGENGMCVFEKSGKMKMIATVAQDVYDVSGAGDTVISTYTLSLSQGAKNIEAAHIANCAAGIVVGKVGIAVTTQEEL